MRTSCGGSSAWRGDARSRRPIARYRRRPARTEPRADVFRARGLTATCTCALRRAGAELFGREYARTEGRRDGTGKRTCGHGVAGASQRHIIERPRLTKLLDGADARIILLVAPAGYGKTTLAREWTASAGGRGSGTARAAALRMSRSSRAACRRPSRLCRRRSSAARANSSRR